MASNAMSVQNLNEYPCSFKCHEFVEQIGDIAVSFQIIKLEDSLYLWVGDNDCLMNDLSLAVPSKYELLPIGTKLMGSVADAVSVNIAKRLTKKVGKPVYVSFNLRENYMALPSIEKRIQEELKKHNELLSF